MSQKFILILLDLDFWQKCTQAPSPSTSLNVSNLIEGRKYDFRIIAVNDAGISNATEM